MVTILNCYMGLFSKQCFMCSEGDGKNRTYGKFSENGTVDKLNFWNRGYRNEFLNFALKDSRGCHYKLPCKVIALGLAYYGHSLKLRASE